jgi:hypothetical protein
MAKPAAVNPAAAKPALAKAAAAKAATKAATKAAPKPAPPKPAPKESAPAESGGKPRKAPAGKRQPAPARHSLPRQRKKPSAALESAADTNPSATDSSDEETQCAQPTHTWICIVGARDFPASTRANASSPQVRTDPLRQERIGLQGGVQGAQRSVAGASEPRLHRWICNLVGAPC